MTPIKSMQSNSSVFSKALATLSVPRAAADPARGWEGQEGAGLRR